MADPLLPWWGWLLVALGVTAAIGITVYFVVYYDKGSNDDTKPFEKLTVHDVTKRAHGAIVPGDKVTLTLEGTHVGKVIWYFSKDDGKSFAQVGSTSTKQVDYKIPADTFSGKCLFRVGDAVDASNFVDSAVFSVKPSFTLIGPGDKTTNTSIIAGHTVTYYIQTASWHLFESAAIVLEKSTGERLKSQIDNNKQTISFKVPATALGTSFKVMAKTTQLLGAEGVQNVQYAVPNALIVLGSSSKGEILQGVFTLFNVIDFTGAAKDTYAPGDNIHYEWATVSEVANVNISWGLSTTGTFTNLVTGVNGKRGHYKFEIPLTIDTTELVYFKVEDASNSANYAIATPVLIQSSWSFGPKPTDLETIVFAGRWAISFLVEIHGYTKSYSTVSSWKTKFTFPSLTGVAPWIPDTTDYALHITVHSAPANLYRFTYLMYNSVPALATRTGPIGAELELAHGQGSYVKAGYEFYLRQPATHGLSTGEAFSSIMYLPSATEDTAPNVEGETLKSSYTPGTYYFEYKGSTAAGLTQDTPPVKWEVLYDTYDASGNAITTDLLAHSNKKYTRGLVNWLAITFPKGMNSSNVRIRVSVSTTDITFKSFTSPAFSVGTGITLLPVTGTNPIALQGIQNRVYMITPGDLIWNQPSSNVTVEESDNGTSGWTAVTHTLQSQEKALYWTPSATGTKYLRVSITTEGLTGVSTVPYTVQAVSSTQLTIQQSWMTNQLLQGGLVEAQISAVPTSDTNLTFEMLDNQNSWHSLDGPHKDHRSFKGILPYRNVSSVQLAIRGTSVEYATGPYTLARGILAEHDASIDEANKVGVTVWHTPNGTKLGDKQTPWNDKSFWHLSIDGTEATDLTLTRLTSSTDAPFPTKLQLVGTWPSLTDGGTYSVVCRFTGPRDNVSTTTPSFTK